MRSSSQRRSGNDSAQDVNHARTSSCPRCTEYSGSDCTGTHSISGCRFAIRESKLVWSSRSQNRRTTSTFSSDIAHAVSLDGVLLSMQSSTAGGDRPRSPSREGRSAGFLVGMPDGLADARAVVARDESGPRYSRKARKRPGLSLRGKQPVSGRGTGAVTKASLLRIRSVFPVGPEGWLRGPPPQL